MAKVDSSFITIKGTLQGMNFYLRKGVPVVRKSGGGFNGKAIKESPNMVRVRENSSEFGHCSTISKVLRQGLFPFFFGWRDKTLHSRVMRLLTQIKDLDNQSARGQRKISLGLETEEGIKLFKNFDFISQTTFDPALGGSIDYDPVHYTCTFSAISAANLKLPKGATHIKILFGVLQVHFGTSVITPFLSDTLIYSISEIPTQFVLCPPSLPPDDEETKIAVLGVRFYQMTGGVLKILQAENAGGIWVLHIEF